MKQALILVLFSPFLVKAQIGPTAGVDSTTFTFATGDSLRHAMFTTFTLIDTSAIVDTSASGEWQIGHTLKPVFSNDTIASRGIMTDTFSVYPPNANSYFTLIIPPGITNPMVEFWHKFETDSAHAGGIVEFSTDSGSTWLNMADCTSMYKEGFYSNTDTLNTGQACFRGRSHGEQLSKIEFIDCMGLSPAPTSCFPFPSGFMFFEDAIFIRFRFVSDSTIDSLSGWMIDSIRVVDCQCPGKVVESGKPTQLHIFPNPASSSLDLSSSKPIGEIAISNALGQTVHKYHYDSEETSIDISGLIAGVYFICIDGIIVGKFVKE